MQEENVERQINHAFRPNSSLPQDDKYSFENYLDAMEQNLGGPLRQFRSRMLDIGNLMCVDEIQRRVYRDMVFAAERDFAALLEQWIEFYELAACKEAIYEQHFAHGVPSGLSAASR